MSKNASYICPECGVVMLRGNPLPRCPACGIRMEYAGSLYDIQRLRALTREKRLRIANTDDSLGG